MKKGFMCPCRETPKMPHNLKTITPRHMATAINYPITQWLRLFNAARVLHIDASIIICVALTLQHYGMYLNRLYKSVLIVSTSSRCEVCAAGNETFFETNGRSDCLLGLRIHVSGVCCPEGGDNFITAAMISREIRVMEGLASHLLSYF